MIRCENLSKVYSSSIGVARSRAFRDILFGRKRTGGVLRPGEFYALHDLSFDLGPGEKLLVLGTPGSGKTTLAKALVGILRPDGGRILVEGSIQSVFPRKLGHFPLTRLKEYLELAPLLFQCSSRGKRFRGSRESLAALAEFCELDPWMKASVRDVPREVLARISFCAPLFIEADYYLFDGPWATGSGPFLKKCQAKVLEVLARRGAVMISGSPKDVPPGFERALVLHQGREAWRGPLKEAGRVFNDLLRGPPGSTAVAGAARPGGAAVDAAGKPNAPLDPAPALFKEIQRIDGTGRPVMAGPWLGEIGLEILYWLPFLAFLKRRFGWGRERLGAISSSGIQPAYEPLCQRYREVHDILQPDALVIWNRKRIREAGNSKQSKVTPFERELAAMCAETFGLPQFDLLHPSHLFKAFGPVWSRAVPLETGQAFLLPTPCRMPPAERPPGLPPPPFIAVSFEFTAFFPDQEKNRAIREEVLRQLSRQGEVVVLEDHEGGASADEGRLHRLRDVAGGPVAAGEVRKRQMQVMEKAAAVVGTWGISLLGPSLGVPTFLLHDGLPGSLSLHLEVARRSALSMENGGALTALDTSERGAGDIVEMVCRMPSGPGSAPAVPRPLGGRR